MTLISTPLALLLFACASCPPDADVPEQLRTCEVDEDCVAVMVDEPSCNCACDAVFVPAGIEHEDAVEGRYRHCRTNCNHGCAKGCMYGFEATCIDGHCELPR